MLQFVRKVRGTEHPVHDNNLDSATDDSVQRKGIVTVLIDIFPKKTDTVCAHDALLDEETDAMSSTNTVLQEKKNFDSAPDNVLQEELGTLSDASTAKQEQNTVLFPDKSLTRKRISSQLLACQW